MDEQEIPSSSDLPPTSHSDETEDTVASLSQVLDVSDPSHRPEIHPLLRHFTPVSRHRGAPTVVSISPEVLFPNHDRIWVPRTSRRRSSVLSNLSNLSVSPLGTSAQTADEAYEEDLMGTLEERIRGMRPRTTFKLAMISPELENDKQRLRAFSDDWSGSDEIKAGHLEFEAAYAMKQFTWLGRQPDTSGLEHHRSLVGWGKRLSVNQIIQARKRDAHSTTDVLLGDTVRSLERFTERDGDYLEWKERFVDD